MVDVDVRVSSHLKEELAWAVDKWLRIFSTIMLFKTAEELKGTSRFKFKTILVCRAQNAQVALHPRTVILRLLLIL